MSEVVENKEIDCHSLLSALQLAAENATSSTSKSYAKTLSTFTAFLQNTASLPASASVSASASCASPAAPLPASASAPTSSPFTLHSSPFTLHPSLLTIISYLSFLFREGYSYATVIYYFENLSTLYRKCVKAGTLPPLLELKTLKNELKSMEVIVDDDLPANLIKIENIARRPVDSAMPLRLETDILLFMLFTCNFSLDSVVQFRKENVSSLNSEAQEIASRYLADSRRFLFPLDQTSRNSGKVATELRGKLNFLLRYNLIPFKGCVEDFVSRLWIAEAFKCGYSSEEVAGALEKIPTGAPALSFSRPAFLDLESRSDMINTVASAFVANPLRWFAMKIRQGATFKEIETAVRESESLSPKIEKLFYPCTEITKRIGKKKINRQVPLISDVAFLRCRATDVAEIFRQIGEWSWCYRLQADPSQPYAIISDKAMADFQRTIGIFTPDIEIFPIGSTPVGEGEQVRIIGGLMAGYVGTVYKILNDTKDSTRRLLRLRLTPHSPLPTPQSNTPQSPSFAFEWTMDIDERQIERL